MRKDCAAPAITRKIHAREGTTTTGVDHDDADLDRWWWVPLVAGCAVIVAGGMVVSELYLALVGRTEPDPWLRTYFLTRGVIVSVLLAIYAGWFVWRSRRRIDEAREALRRQTAALQEQQRRSAQRVTMDATTRILAHEIRNPLNNMQLNCVVLERAITTLPPDRRERVAQVCAVLRGEIERLTTLSAGYLSGREIAIRRDPVILEDLAAEALRVHQPRIDARRLRVAVDGAGTPVTADPDRLRQLLHNLLGNAIDAVGDGGEIAIRCATDGDQVTLEVVDDGPGFAHLDRAFQLFHTTKVDGSGLGLAVVCDIARMHGGEAFAANRASGGAHVTVRVPVGRP